MTDSYVVMEDHTFVIPVYMESPYLEACIQSLCSQTVKSKIIITTSTPSMFSRNIAAAYNLPYLVNQTDATDVTSNWNFALSKSDTKLVTIAHQDDIYEKNYAEVVIKQVSNYNKKDLLIAFTNYTDMIDGKLRGFSLNALVKNILLLPFFFTKKIRSIFFKKLILVFGNPICCPTVTFNMEMLKTFKFNREYRCVLDWYAWYELAQKPGAFLYVNDKLIKRRLHLDSGTAHLINNGEKRQDELRVFELIWGKRFAKIISSIYTLGYKDNLL